MAKQTISMQKKTLNAPDEVRTFDKGKVELATVGTVTFGRANFQPGWKWSESVKPIVKTEYCQAPHVWYQVSGRLTVKMADGSEQEFGPGDAGVIPPGHDAWVVGNEPVVAIDISGMTHYAKPAARKVVKKSAKAKTRKKKR
jgi:mannose-6-phosphate isomerase-like protein (cupin superfamily)